MEIKAVTRPIEVLIEQGKEEFGFKFKQPEYKDIVKLGNCNSDEEFIEVVNNLFIEFINKPIVKDEDKNILEFKDVVEFLELPLHFKLKMEIITKLVNEFTKTISAEEVEKKS